MMNRQRGMAQGWILLIGIIVLVSAITAGVVALNAHETRIDKQGYERGVTETRSKYDARDKKALEDAIKERDALMATVRGLEKVHAEETNTLRNQLRKEMVNEIRKRETTIAGLRDGSIVLRDPGGQTAAGCPGVTVAGGGATAGSVGSGTDAAGGAKLSRPTAEFLISEASRADTVARKVNTLQTQILADRKACTTSIASRK